MDLDFWGTNNSLSPIRNSPFYAVLAHVFHQCHAKNRTQTIHNITIRTIPSGYLLTLTLTLAHTKPDELIERKNERELIQKPYTEHTCHEIYLCKAMVPIKYRKAENGRAHA